MHEISEQAFVEAVAEAQMWRGRFNDELNKSAMLERNGILLEMKIAQLQKELEEKDNKGKE